MEKQQVAYQKPEDYELLKEIFLEKVKMMKGDIPQGFNNDIFLSSFIKIYKFLTQKYKTVKIQKNDIPDIERFEQREEYTVSQFIFNRIVNNIEKVDVESVNDYKQTCGGYYSAGEKLLRIFPATIKNATDLAFEKYKTLNFASNEDFNKIVTEYNIIHELIHAISFDDFTIGFRLDEKSVSINEGFTDSLALEISGFGSFFEYLPKQMEDNSFYMLPSNSTSNYIIETNIADLIRIATKKDLTLPYLINPTKAKWNSVNRLDETCYPLEKNQDVYGYLEKELYEICNKNSTLCEKEKIERVQDLQSCLLKDILKNKYNSDFIEKIKYRDVTVEEAQQYDKDIATIMNKIVLSFPEETASKIMILGAQSLEIWNTDKLEQMLKDGKISDTKNLEIYIELIKMKIELYNYFNQTKEENITI